MPYRLSFPSQQEDADPQNKQKIEAYPQIGAQWQRRQRCQTQRRLSPCQKPGYEHEPVQQRQPEGKDLMGGKEDQQKPVDDGIQKGKQQRQQIALVAVDHQHHHRQGDRCHGEPRKEKAYQFERHIIEGARFQHKAEKGDGQPRTEGVEFRPQIQNTQFCEDQLVPGDGDRLQILEGVAVPLRKKEKGTHAAKQAGQQQHGAVGQRIVDQIVVVGMQFCGARGIRQTGFCKHCECCRKKQGQGSQEQKAFAAFELVQFAPDQFTQYPRLPSPV